MFQLLLAIIYLAFISLGQTLILLGITIKRRPRHAPIRQSYFMLSKNSRKSA